MDLMTSSNPGTLRTFSRRMSRRLQKSAASWRSHDTDYEAPVSRGIRAWGWTQLSLSFFSQRQRTRRPTLGSRLYRARAGKGSPKIPAGSRSYSCAGAASTGERSWAARGTRARRLWHVDPAKQSHSERADSGMTTWDPGVSGSQRKQRSRLGCPEGECGAGPDWRQSAQLGVYLFIFTFFSFVFSLLS
jgi:hypothetical protein